MATLNLSSLASYPQPTAECSQRVALYGRVSTNDKGQIVESQLRQLQEFAIQSGWTIVAEYVDHESGKVSERVEFQRMFAAASKRRFEVLLFWSLDRLSREGVLANASAFAAPDQLRRGIPQLYRAVLRQLRALQKTR